MPMAPLMVAALEVVDDDGNGLGVTLVLVLLLLLMALSPHGECRFFGTMTGLLGRGA